MATYEQVINKIKDNNNPVRLRGYGRAFVSSYNSSSGDAEIIFSKSRQVIKSGFLCQQNDVMQTKVKIIKAKIGDYHLTEDLKNRKPANDSEKSKFEKMLK